MSANSSVFDTKTGSTLPRRWLNIAKVGVAAMVVSAAAALAASASAAEIIFYEYEGLTGQQLSLRNTNSNFEPSGFNDRANSIRVRSGTWLVCTDAEFRGTCATFARGEYRSLDARFTNQISSAREVETYGSSTGDYASRQRPLIEFFEQREFAGQSLLLDADTENFSPLGFNDRAISLIVSGGTWELCTDAGYRGICRIYQPGRYNDLGAEMAREISSARLQSSAQNFSATTGNGNGDGVGEGNSNPGKLMLYDADGFLGHGVSITGDVANLDHSGFNDATQSIVIERGAWEFCTNANFKGVCRVMGVGYYRRLDADLYRAISSIRASTAAPVSMGGRPGGGRNPNDGAELVIYDHRSFTGRSFGTRTSIDNLTSKDFNDRAMSMIIHAGRWQLCSDANYVGRCAVFGPGQYEHLQDLNNRLSSIKRIM